MNFNLRLAAKSLAFISYCLFNATFVSATTRSESLIPVEKVVTQSIKARVTEKSVLIDWNTVAEVNNGHFEVERSSDLKKFDVVALVLDGFNTPGSGKRYSFKEDVSVLKNGKTAYYRLKQVDEYGQVVFSEVVKVQSN
ncbi:MAG: hypothetical protein IPL84_14240 [Chitinophagaceae bacterium]|nr:hypothetical protein [Chitinophagaceae bacterium]